MTGAQFVWSAIARASGPLIALGLAGTALNAGLVAVVHRALETDGERRTLAIAFVALALGKAIAAYASGRIADSCSQQSVAELRRELITRLLAVPYQRFERLGVARAYAALTSDVMTVNSALQVATSGLVNAAVLCGGAGYLLYLDYRVFAALLVLATGGFAIYRAMGTRARTLLRKARAEHDRLFAHFHALTDGAKELKLHADRRDAFLSGPLSETSRAMHEYAIRGNARYLLGQAINGLLVLALIGLVLFAFAGGRGSDSGVASGYVLVALYLTGPLSSLLRLIPSFAAAEIALQRIRDVGVELGGDPPESSRGPGDRAVFRSLELRDVDYRYEGGTGFEFGPLSLRLVPGEIVFVTGGNGSGKSTFAKLLTGLYEPAAGTLLWDGEPVTTDNRDAYRQLFSAVFSEFHVFDRLYGLEPTDLDARARVLIAELGLARAVQVEDGRLSSIDLSRGQRKRLALLTALLEDRPIYVFDEWAADQDAEFRQVFYRQLLPALKQRGKTVVAVTHDDRWFDVADRTLELRDGRLASAADLRSVAGEVSGPA